MWILFAFGSALFAGLTAILAKCGVRRTDSTVATAIRTIVVLVFSWLMVFLTGAQSGLGAVGGRTLLFLALSGLATGASWLCYFKALQLGDVNKVTPVDKSSTVLTVLLAFVLLKEPVGAYKALGVLCVGAGTYLMIEKKAARETGEENGPWLPWAMVFVTGKGAALREVPRGELGFICLSGLATGASWLCYYRALQDGPASVVVPIDKLSILVTVAFSGLVLHERLSRRAALGLALLTGGTLIMLRG